MDSSESENEYVNNWEGEEEEHFEELEYSETSL